MENNLARFTCYAAFLVDGNVITDKLSIGGKSDKTGPDPPNPATVAGLSTHNLFEGDTSMTRGEMNTTVRGSWLILSPADAYFGGDNNFNETLFQEVRRLELYISTASATYVFPTVR